MDKLIELAEIFIKERLDTDISDGHDCEHTFRVVKHALDIANEIPQANRQIVHLAAILHDVERPAESLSQGKIDHAAAGAETAYRFLVEQHAPENIAQRVADCIRTHRFRSSGTMPETIEAKILYDADKLDSLGAVGIARAFLFAGRIGAKVHNSADDALKSESYSMNDTAYREYLVKLSKIPGKMFTAPAKIRANELKIFMDNFFNQLNCEFFV